MGILKTFIFFLLLLGCTKYPTLIKESGGIHYFTADNLNIKNPVVVPWEVGVKKKEIISKGFHFGLVLPKLKNKDFAFLNKTYGFDSWLLKIQKNTPLGETTIGYTYVPLFIPGRFGHKKFRDKQIKSVQIGLSYAAASTSKMESLDCPLFDHHYRITELKIINTNGIPKFLFSRNMNAMDISLENFHYSPFTINGGIKLFGTYMIEIAAFDYDTKTRTSNWVDIPRSIRVVDEEEIPPSDCLNFEPPPERPQYKDWKRFKWKNKTHER